MELSNEPIPELWPSILNREFWIQFSIAKANREKLVKLIKMGKISEILLNSLFVTSAYANSFAVPSCNNDTPVSSTLSFWMICFKWWAWPISIPSESENSWFSFVPVRFGVRNFVVAEPMWLGIFDSAYPRNFIIDPISNLPEDFEVCFIYSVPYGPFFSKMN